LLRAVSLLVGAAVLIVLLACGLLVAGVLLIGGGLLLARRAWRRAAGVRDGVPPAMPAGQRAKAKVIEGEFVVLSQGRSR
jgi:uncharacterized membrane protein